jgi:hypothetical protein
MSTATATSTYTRTHTATYLAEVILGAIGDLLGELGINSDRLYSQWKIDEAAIKKWIEEESLDTVVLECHRPDGTVAPIIEFPVVYNAYGLGDKQFTAQRAKLARYSAKIARAPAGTTWGIICTFRTSYHTPMDGWSPTSLASTSGLRSTSVGVLASAPHASTSVRIHT